MAGPETFVNVRNLFELRGRNYLVTGGAQGIGLAITRSIAQMGGNVVALDIQEKPGDGFDGLSKQYGVKTEYIQADVTNEESHTAAFNRAVEVLGSIDGCVTSAGIAIEKAFEEQNWEEVRKVQDVNVTGTFFTTQLATKQMKKQGTGGSIVLIASITAHTVLPHHRMAAYSASKGAVKMLSECLAVELAPYKIRTNTISPGFIDTEMTQAVRNVNAKIAAIMSTAPPLQRIGTREDLVGAAIYLLSDASSYTTGADIAITGGLHIGRIDT